MKQIICLAHDPGGYDVIAPLAQALVKQGQHVTFFCAGAAANKCPENAIDNEKLKINIDGMLKKNKVALLLTGTSWGSFIELNIMRKCKDNGIKTIAVLDYWSNYKNRFQVSDEEIIYPDYYCLMDDFAKRKALQEGVPSSIIRIIGHPGLDKLFRCNRRTFDCCKLKKQSILFLSQPLSLLYGNSLGYTEESVIEDILKLAARYKASLNIKFHPKDRPEIKSKYKDLEVDGDTDLIMLEHDLIIGMNTMGLLHAIIMGVPVISYQPNLMKTDECITNILGFTKQILSYESLEQEFEEINGPQGIPISEQNTYIWMDGKSTERGLEIIHEAMNA